jgi:Tfp pilus assembly protein PilF
MTTILLLLSMVFHPSASAPQGLFTIMGNIRSTDNRTVDSIRVSLMDDNYQTIKTVFTDTTGRYRFPPIRSGTYIVRVQPVGQPYEEAEQRVELQPVPGGSGTAVEPVLVDLVLKLKKGVVETRVNEVVFAQNIPEAARAEYKQGSERLKDNPEEGIAFLKNAIKIFPDYYLALELLGTEYVKRGEYEAALPVLTHALEVNQRNAPKSLYAIGVAYLKLKRPAEAIQWLTKAAEQDGGNANVHMMLGLAHGYNNALKDAEASLKKAYELGGSQAAESHLYLAGIYNKQEKYGDAVKQLEMYLKEADEKTTDKEKVKEMIKKLKEKQKAKS